MYCRSLCVPLPCAQFRKAQFLVRLTLLFFILYMADLVDWTAKYRMSLHAYADDTQLYLYFNRTEIASSVYQLERCVLDIRHWMSANGLKLNADKTELLFASSSYSCAMLSGSYPALQLGVDIGRGHKLD